MLGIKKKAQKGRKKQNPDDPKTTSGAKIVYDQLLKEKKFENIKSLITNKRLFENFVTSLKIRDIKFKIKDYNNLFYIYYLEFYDYGLKSTSVHKILLGISFKGPANTPYSLITQLEEIKKLPSYEDLHYYRQNHIPTSMYILRSYVLSYLEDKLPPYLLERLSIILEPVAL